MKKEFTIISKGLTGVLVISLLVFGSPLMGPCSDSMDNPEGETLKPALIKDKDNYGVLIDGRRYQVDESTVILDLLGKKISICDLPVPCRALVTFIIREGLEPIALRIEVRRLLEDTTDKE